MFRPTNSRLQSNELECLADESNNKTNIPPVPTLKNGKPDYWTIFMQSSSQKESSTPEKAPIVDDLEQETSLLQTKERYAGFLTALDSINDIKPKVQSNHISSDTNNDSKSIPTRGNINPTYTQIGGRLVNSDKSVDSKQYLEDYSFDKTKYQHSNPVLGTNRLTADLDFRQQMMKPTRFD